MKIRITIEVDKENREKLAQFLGKHKPADRTTCEMALRGAAIAEIDSWYLEASEKAERDSDQEYKEYKASIEEDENENAK